MAALAAVRRWTYTTRRSCTEYGWCAPVLLITGPVGVGKTTVALEAGELLEAAGIPHAVVDLDALAWCFPPPADDRFNNRLALRNLAVVWANFAAAGAERLVIARVAETGEDVAAFLGAVPHAAITVVRLRARDDTLLARVRARGWLGQGVVVAAVTRARAADGRAGAGALPCRDGRPRRDRHRPRGPGPGRLAVTAPTVGGRAGRSRCDGRALAYTSPT